MQLHRRLLVAGLLLAGLALPASANLDYQLRIDPANTRVGLARVKLQVADLRIGDEAISGTYHLRIPLAPLLNDRGKLEFELDRPLAQTARAGGTLQGRGHSILDGRTHEVRCDFDPDGQVVISVETPERTLVFKTRYSLA